MLAAERSIAISLQTLGDFDLGSHRTRLFCKDILLSKWAMLLVLSIQVNVPRAVQIIAPSRGLASDLYAA
jgi:hypothetical protein